MQAVGGFLQSTLHQTTAIGGERISLTPSFLTTVNPVYYTMLDKTDPPVVPDTYNVQIAFTCVLDIVKGISSLVTIPVTSSLSTEIKGNQLDVMVNSSWVFVLSSLSQLLRLSSNAIVTGL